MPQGKLAPLVNNLIIHFLAKDDRERTIFETAFVQGNELDNKIRQHLKRPNCNVPNDLQIHLHIIDQPSPGLDQIEEKRFHIRHEKREEPSRTPPRARLEILRGSTEKETYGIGEARTNIGRLPEVVDEYGRVVRRNDVVFLEIETLDNKITRTVSHVHAHICFDGDTDEFRLWDDGSKNGTSVIREGRPNPIEVPKGGSRGVKLCPGDEICLGQARVRFQIE